MQKDQIFDNTRNSAVGKIIKPTLSINKEVFDLLTLQINLISHKAVKQSSELDLWDYERTT